MTMMTSTELCDHLRCTPEALGRLVSSRVLLAPDEHGQWDADRARKRLATHQKRQMRRRMRRGISRPEAERQYAEAARDAWLLKQLITEDGETTTDVWDGHGHYIGDVVKDVDHIGVVWRIRPLSRQAHANTWELPCSTDRRAAAHALFHGDYTL